MAFDPYHKWLGIPPEEQPPNHYRLLAIPQFESDADVIEAAAEQRTLLLRTFQIGPDAELAERLLNEVAAARVCLLRPASKAEYDDSLRDVGIEVVPPQPPGLDRHDPTKTRSESYLVSIVAGGLLLIPLIGVLWWFMGRGDSKEVVISKTPSMQQGPDSLKQGLIAYYPFNGNTKDESGNGHHVTNSSVVFSSDRYGNPDNALAPEQKLIVSDDVDFRIGRSNPREFSVALWCYLKDRSATFRLLKSPGNGSSGFVDWRLSHTSSGIIWGTGPSASGKGGSNRSSWQMTVFRPLPKRWTLVTATYFNRGDEKRKQVYINGELIDENVIGKKNTDTNSPVVIQTGVGAILDDVRIYNRALSAEEVKALYEYEKP